MIDHMSYSSISLYLSCARAWQFRYLQKVETPTSPELVFGTAWHGTLESNLAAKATNGAETPDLLATWSQQWAKATEGKNIEFGLDSPESFANEGIRLLSHPEIQRGIAQLAVGVDDKGPKIERKVELHVPGVPIPIIGFIDMIASDAVPGDFKTSARAWSQDKADGETQPLFYLAALNQAGIQTPGWRFRHYVFVKTQKPQVQVLEHRHNPAQLMWLFGMVRKVWTGIEREVFPENPTTWKCNPTYCEFWGLCRGRHA